MLPSLPIVGLKVLRIAGEGLGEVGRNDGGLVLIGVEVARHSCTGNSSAQGSCIVSPTRARGESSSM